MKEEIYSLFKERLKSPTWAFILISYVTLKFDFLALFIKGPLKSEGPEYYTRLSIAHFADFYFLLKLIFLSSVLYVIFRLTDILFKLITVLIQKLNNHLDSIDTITMKVHDEKMNVFIENSRKDIYSVLSKFQVYNSGSVETRYNFFSSVNGLHFSPNTFVEVVRDSGAAKIKNISGKSKFQVEHYAFIVEKMSDDNYLCAEINGTNLIPYKWDDVNGSSAEKLYVYQDGSKKIDPEIAGKFIIELKKYNDFFAQCSYFPKTI